MSTQIPPDGAIPSHQPQIFFPITKVSRANLAATTWTRTRPLGVLKERILQLLGLWEKRKVQWQEVTLYNSASTATAAVLVALKRLGVRTILFETPAYSVTINQAKHGSYKIVLCPTYFRDEFALGEPAFPKTAHPIALWLTQPRMSLGFNQDIASIEKLRTRLSANDFLVIDEATEQSYPSVLHRLPNDSRAASILRIRGILKPMGLNGLRLACVFHDAKMRESLKMLKASSALLWICIVCKWRPISLKETQSSSTCCLWRIRKLPSFESGQSSCRWVPHFE